MTNQKRRKDARIAAKDRWSRTLSPNSGAAVPVRRIVWTIERSGVRGVRIRGVGR